MVRFPLNDKRTLSEDELILGVVRQCMIILMDCGFFKKRSQIKKMDTIDLSEYGKNNCNGELSALPSMKQTEREAEVLKETWTVMIPPLLEGVVRLNVHRYLEYNVTHIDMDAKSYEVEITDYGFDNDMWGYNATIVATIIHNGTNKPDYRIQSINTADLLNATFIGNIDMGTNQLDNASLEVLRNLVIPRLREIDKDEQENSVMNHFISSIVMVNCELMSGEKPKAVRTGKTYNVKTVTDKEPERNPKPQIVRALKSGITIKSEKVPKAPTIDVIRHYKVASWSVRGHIRHLKNGKTVYIKPTVRKRKEFENENVAKRQTIIVAGRSN